jgi:small subunit ribosomal protein S3
VSDRERRELERAAQAGDAEAAERLERLRLRSGELLAMVRRLRANAAVCSVTTTREGERTLVTIHTGRPGILIGRRGATAERVKQELAELLGTPVRLHIVEVRHVELEPLLVADAVLQNLSRGVDLDRTLERQSGAPLRAGATGCRIVLSGALGDHERTAQTPDAVDPFDHEVEGVRHATSQGECGEGLLRCEVWIQAEPRS